MDKVAIVHEWFIHPGGSEKVIEELVKIYPQADLFCLLDFLPKEQRGFLREFKVQTSFLQKIPGIARTYRSFLALMPLAIEQMDLEGYDLVLSNCHAVSKGVITGPDQLHISYVYTPIRYAWEMQNSYLEAGRLSGIKGGIARMMLHYIRSWDSLAATRPDAMIAISKFVAGRIHKIYRREAKVIYPPVDTEFFTSGDRSEEFYLTASRLVPYKRVDLIVEAFRGMPEKKLVVIGNGPEEKRIKKSAASNVAFLGYQPQDRLRDYLRRCKAFIFGAKEDFGLLPLEAQACGKPVIAFGQGGVLETIRGLDHPQPTGIFFQSQTTGDILAAINQFEHLQDRFTPTSCRENAERFSSRRFRQEFKACVDREKEGFSSTRLRG